VSPGFGLRQRRKGGATLALPKLVMGSLTASSSSAVASTVASSARGLRVGEVDADAAAVKVLVVEAVDGTVGLVLRGEGDEAEAARLSGLTVLRK
jgi:hypothetical protein